VKKVQVQAPAALGDIGTKKRIFLVEFVWSGGEISIRE
jgi:hypothetical protein